MRIRGEVMERIEECGDFILQGKVHYWQNSLHKTSFLCGGIVSHCSLRMVLLSPYQILHCQDEVLITCHRDIFLFLSQSSPLYLQSSISLPLCLYTMSINLFLFSALSLSKLDSSPHLENSLLRDGNYHLSS